MPERVRPIINHNKYEKIVDDMFILGRNTIMKFNVILAKYNDKFGRVDYHKEFEYYNKDARFPTITMRRDFEYYLSIENIRIDDITPEKQFIMITVNDILGFRSFLDDISKWFESKQYAGLYATKDGELIMTKAIKPITILLPPNPAYITAEPIVCVSKFNDRLPGIRLYLASETTYVEMTLNKVQGLKYLIYTMDMYSCACNLINYLQRPELGSNLVSFSGRANDEIYQPEAAIPATPSTGRRVQNRKPKLEDL